MALQVREGQTDPTAPASVVARRTPPTTAVELSFALVALAL